MVTSSGKKWIEHDAIEDSILKEIAQELEVSELFIEVCFQRGLTSAAAIKDFLTFDESDFHDPFLMYDMEKAVKRIESAVAEGEHITIYGDYDADGMTSTALLLEALSAIGAHVDYYLPNRFIEGYGPDMEAFKKISEQGTSLIITVDNGVAGHEEIHYIQEQGVDVIVTDHHALPAELPEAYALIHPGHPEGDYPFKELAGVGVALKLVHALMGEIPAELLDLAAIGTVADLVSLTGENRTIVHFGLQMLNNTQRFGLLELYKLSGTEPGNVDETTIGFQIAPRLNAVGRLGEARPCIELLTTLHVDEAKTLAELVDSKNVERKAIVEDMTEMVAKKLENQEHEVIVLGDESWHQGVLGIVASRIVEQTGKPTFLFTIDSKTGIAKGSARSVDYYNLYNAMNAHSDLFIQYGGHHMAAGMSANKDDLTEIQARLSEYALSLPERELIQEIDLSLALSEISIVAIKEVERLQPFGTGNKKPLVAIHDVSVNQTRQVGEKGNHLKMIVEQDDKMLDIISFQNGRINDLLYEQQEIAVAGYIEINEWNGLSKPQMQMIDVNIPGPILVDRRKNKLTAEDFTLYQGTYIFYDKRTYDTWARHVTGASEAILLTDVGEVERFTYDDDLIIVDCPTSVNLLKKTLADNQKNKIFCYFYKEDHLFLTGLPTHDDFKNAYKFFASYQNINLAKDGHLVSRELKLDNNKIILIVQVFLELNFVIIDNGLLNIVKNPDKQNILNTIAYQKAQQQLEAEELFIYSSFKEIITHITQ